MADGATTDFFQRQDDARRNTGRLLFLFGLAIFVLSVGTYVAIGAIWVGFDPQTAPLLEGGQLQMFDVGLAIAALLGTGVFIFLGSMFKTSNLKKGGSAVAETLGGTEVDSSAKDPQIRRLVNVVEEMSLASGVPVPRIYVLKNEPGINAFAAGYSTNDAAVAVTQGALDQLTRDELQGVIAHEFSHILNGDMRLNIQLIGVIHGILLMYLTGRVMLRLLFSGGSRRSGRRSRGGGGGGGGAIAAFALAGAVLALFGLGGLLCGRMIKSAVSRQREYLADAAAVQFTRNPDGLAGALKKIGGYSHGSRLQATEAEEVSHMCFGRVKRKWNASSWFSTHPPLEKRIRAIDPSFDGTYEVIKGPSKQRRVALDTSRVDVDRARALAGGSDSSSGAQGSMMAQGAAVAAMASASGPRRQMEFDVDVDEVVESVGTVSPDRLTYCASLLKEIPEPLMEARSNLMGAMAVVYTLLLDEDAEERKKQSRLLKKYAQPGIVEEAKRLWPAVGELNPELRLPLVDLLMPTLRRMTASQFQAFSAMVDRLIWADDKVILEEFVLEKVVLHHLEVALHDASRKVVQFHSWAALTRDVENVLSCLAHVGHDSEGAARTSFAEGLSKLPPKIGNRLEYRPPEAWTFSNISASLDRLSVSSPMIKKKVVEACAYCVMGDGEVVVEEAEMLRAICESLDVPLPPFIPKAAQRA